MRWYFCLGREKDNVGQAFRPDWLAWSAGEPDLLCCRRESYVVTDPSYFLGFERPAALLPGVGVKLADHAVVVKGQTGRGFEAVEKRSRALGERGNVPEAGDLVFTKGENRAGVARKLVALDLERTRRQAWEDVGGAGRWAAR